MLMYDEVSVVLFLWRSQHEQLWKDYREYTLKDILSTTKHSFSGVLLLLLKCCEFLFGGSHLLSGPAMPHPFPLLLWGNPKAKLPLLLTNCGASWWPSAFRSRIDCSGICYTVRSDYLELHYFPRLFFYAVQNFRFFCFCFFLLFFLIASNFWLCIQRTPQGADLILLVHLKGK